MRTPLRRIPGAVLAAAATTLLVLGGAAPASAAPPPPPSLDEVRGLLAELEVEDEGSGSDYDRDLFPHWSTVEGNCNTREHVLKRDGDGVETGEDCYPTAGSWTSVFDDVTVSDPSEISVDHFVPLAEAWRSGADTWTTDEREKFANDIDTGQLWAVTPASNSAKGDKDPAKWMPEQESIHCDYALTWVHVKSTWKLSIDAEEKAAVEGLLDSAC
ncbi:HNH endonuclease family protein [Murinocardiopsis flavida]|nr:HNH endonuclease family protein [Murinocardiopsis flavida]